MAPNELGSLHGDQYARGVTATATEPRRRPSVPGLSRGEGARVSVALAARSDTHDRQRVGASVRILEFAPRLGLFGWGGQLSTACW